MRKADEVYSNGQKVSEQNGDVLTYYFENGEIKAQGKYVNGKMQNKWIFNKKEGYLWQVGHFNESGVQHGKWTRYNPDGSVQQEKYFENGKVVKP
jgi:antitoxin component YwqK of YwqJK toxin-antitoxin module